MRIFALFQIYSIPSNEDIHISTDIYLVFSIGHQCISTGELFKMDFILIVLFFSFQESDKALRKQLIDYLRETERENLVHQQRMELRKHLQQYEENLSDEDQSDDNPDARKQCEIFLFSIEGKCLDSLLDSRRKAVGLGDNPFK